MSTELQIGQQPGAYSQGVIPSQSETPSDALSPQTLPVGDLLGGNSLVVSRESVDIFALVEHLKLATQRVKEETQQKVMSSAISAVLGRIAATDEEQARLLEDIGKKTDEYLSLSEKIAKTIVDCYAADPTVKTLEMKVKELEEAVERMRKTPEERKKELEKKESELAQAQKDLDAARSAALEKDETYQGLVQQQKALESDIAADRAKLDKQSINILSQAFVDLFFSFKEGGPETEKERVPDGLVTFLKLLGGENLLDTVQNMLDEIQSNREVHV